MDKHGVHGVAHEDCTTVNTGTHLATWSTKRWEELGVDQSRFLIFKSAGHIPSESEIRVLVDGAGNQGRNFLDRFGICSKNVREGGSKSCASLDGRKVHFSDVVAILNPISRDFPIERNNLEYYISVKPKVALLWFPVIHRETLTTFS